MGKGNGTTRASNPRKASLTASYLRLQEMPMIEKKIYKAFERDVLKALNKAAANMIGNAELDEFKHRLSDKYELLATDVDRLFRGLDADTDNAINYHDNFGQNVVLLDNLKQRQLDERKRNKNNKK